MNRSLIAAVLFAGCVSVPATGRITFESGSIITTGYTHHAPDTLRDTPTASGSFESLSTGLSIGYAAFTYGLSFAEPSFLTRRGDTVIWTRRSSSGRTRRITTLYTDQFHHRTLCISFPDGGPTNFIIESPTPEQIAEAERFVSTFIPRSTNDA